MNGKWIEFLGGKDIQERYFKDSGNEITAFEHINLALAVLKQNRT
ncbi:MAG: hypothetical protein ACI4IS_01960 [Acutalibacteraceae bacterium]